MISKYEKALELAALHIEESAEPDCTNCPLVRTDGSVCPNGEETTERCRDFIKEYFLKEAEKCK